MSNQDEISIEALMVELSQLTAAVETLDVLRTSIKTYGLEPQLRAIVASTECISSLKDATVEDICVGIESVVDTVWTKLQEWWARIKEFFKKWFASTEAQLAAYTKIMEEARTYLTTETVTAIDSSEFKNDETAKTSTVVWASTYLNTIITCREAFEQAIIPIMDNFDTAVTEDPMAINDKLGAVMERGDTLDKAVPTQRMVTAAMLQSIVSTDVPTHIAAIKKFELLFNSVEFHLDKKFTKLGVIYSTSYHEVHQTDVRMIPKPEQISLFAGHITAYTNRICSLYRKTLFQQCNDISKLLRLAKSYVK